jgi:hypothetical protein
MTPRGQGSQGARKAARQAGEDAAEAVKDETGVGDRPPSDPRRLREEINEDRQELGDTVEALAQKADVKGQVEEKVAERKEQLRGAQEQIKAKLGETAEQAKQRPAPIGAVAGGLVPRARPAVADPKEVAMAKLLYKALGRAWRDPGGHDLQPDLEARLRRAGGAQGEGERVRLEGDPAGRRGAGRPFRPREGRRGRGGAEGFRKLTGLWLGD